MALEFNPMRSWIFTDLKKEQYRHKLLSWHMLHVSDSISQFQPYVTKYAFYQAMPAPPESERFGVAKFHLCEHYWLVNPMLPEMVNTAYQEYFPMECLKWQGSVPDDDSIDDKSRIDGTGARSTGGEDDGVQPFVFGFMPISWEDDLKGRERTIMDGPNYRFHCMIQYPKGVSMEEGDKWLFEEVIAKFKDMPEVLRIMTSKIKQEVNNCVFQRVFEMWFDGPEEWYTACVTKMADMKKPSWAQQDKFPFLKPKFNISCIFTPDIPYSDNLTQYRGTVYMR